MIRLARLSQQLDLFRFKPVVLPVDRGPPVVELPLVPRPPKAPEPAVPFQITGSLGEGSLRRKCENNLKAIELLQQLGNRSATAAEREVLVRFVGWGSLPQVFDPNNAAWTSQRLRLQALLSPEDFASARATTLNAHYTPADVIQAVWKAVEHLGFQGGRVLEPACGLGHFLGLMPEALRRTSTFTGIEIDSVTARLAGALYPESDVRCVPFEESKLPDDAFDLAISNVPFGDYRPYDPRFPMLLIHDYFFAASLARVRPGGLIAFITSKGTFDKKDATLRAYMAERAELLGAIRLPNTTFQRNAHTEVTTDIVFLRKRLEREPISGPAWLELSTHTNAHGEAFAINEYFARHPDQMLGEMRLVGSLYRAGEPALVPNGRDLPSQLAEAVQRLPAGRYSGLRPDTRPPAVTKLDSPAKPGSFCVHEGRLAHQLDGELRVLANLPTATAQRIKGLISVRDALRACLEAQWRDLPEEELSNTRALLNQSYDRFVDRFGCLSDRRNVSAFRGDPDLPLLLSVEHLDQGKVTKAAVFRERTLSPKRVLQATDPKSALLVSLAEKGRVDPEFLSQLLQQPADSILEALQGLVFLDPATGQWQPEDAYLSGNVREKLLQAEAAARKDSSYLSNVAALRGVQPEDLGPTDIDARLGCAWMPPDVLQSFTEDLLGERGVEISHSALIGTWVVKGAWNVRIAVSNSTEWGTERRSALDLIEDALNLRVPTLYDADGDRLVVNGPATEAARDRQQKIRERFTQWVWTDDTRRERLCRLYNDQFNALRLRTYSGNHLQHPGASSAVTLRSHQKAAIWRILQNQNTLLAHVVGAGKTFTMVAAGMELRRLGLARKPLFVVPNHMLEQFARELLTLYPAANLLVATREDFEKQRRQTLMSRMATGNWDAVIVTHSGFEKIPLSKATRSRFFETQLTELEAAIADQRERGSRMVKELEKAKKRLETQLKELLNEERKDDGLTFEQLGVDRLFVDEAHHFKNLFYVSKMTRIAGLPQTASKRALDMFLKVRHVQDTGGGVVFATGTPIANSVAEMFTLQRFLQSQTLRALGVAHFDAWAGTFGEPVTAMELSPDGSGYRVNTRFARFINVPELMAQFRQVADIQTASMLNLPVPALRGGRPTVIRAECSPELKAIVQELVARAERLKSRQVGPKEDNMLLVTTDGRKAALDLRLHRPELPDHPGSKVNHAVAEVARIWRETTRDRATQLVFCDLSTPGKGFSVYQDMRQKLVLAGIPEAEIAFIQEYDTDAAKAGLFRDVRSGRIRILFGSTAKMGSGTNVQERLVALHHLDAPWRPADVEQREGRILRQGNRNPEVQIYRYVTAESFDAYMWQCLETKARFIAQVMTGDTSLRRLEDVDGAALTYAEVKAIASGNPLVIEKANVDAELARLTWLRSQHVEAGYRIRTQVRHLMLEIPRWEQRLEALKSDLVFREETRGDRFVMELGGQRLTDRGVAGEMLIRLGERLRQPRAERKVGQFAGFELWAVTDLSGELQLVLKGNTEHTTRLQQTAHGTTRALEYLVNHLEDSVAQAVDTLAQSRKRLADLQAQEGQPFEYATRLAELAQRQRELVEALDLNRNQAVEPIDSKLAEPVNPIE